MDNNKTVLTPQEIHDLADAMPWEDVADIGAYWHESVRIIERAVLAKLPGMPADAWMHEDDPQRVISASQKAGAEQDGGASASSVKPYSIALGRIHPAPSEATGKPALQVGASEADPVIRNPLITASEAGAVPVAWRYWNEKSNSWNTTTSQAVADAMRDGGRAVESLYAAPPSAPAAEPLGYVAEWCTTDKRNGRVTVHRRSRITTKHQAQLTAKQWAKRSPEPDYGPMRATPVYLAAPAAESAEPARCQYCDGTGDVHSLDGEWRGECTECKATTATADAQGDERAEEDRIDALRLKAFRTNDPDDRRKYFEATSKWFQDRDYRALSRQPSAPAKCKAGLYADCGNDFGCVGCPEPSAPASAGDVELPPLPARKLARLNERERDVVQAYALECADLFVQADRQKRAQDGAILMPQSPDAEIIRAMTAWRTIDLGDVGYSESEKPIRMMQAIYEAIRRSLTGRAALAAAKPEGGEA